MPQSNSGVSTHTVFVPRPPADCWRVFTDVALLASWVPGLRRARAVAVDEGGRPSEILFEFAASLTYSLVYRYDPAAHELWWEPRAGKRDAVRGGARFDAEAGGTRLRYHLAQGDGRSASERALADPERLLAAFVACMAQAPRR
ncbi:MAG: SRPBCC family protein [Kofleriaceae bacterium]